MADTQEAPQIEVTPQAPGSVREAQEALLGLMEPEEDKPKDDGFIIEWEEEASEKQDKKKQDKKTKEKKTKEKKTKEKTKPKKKKKGLGKFIDKIAEPEAEEYEDFDDI